MQDNITFRAKRQPLAQSPSPTPIFDATKKKHPFLMFLLEPLIILFCFVVLFPRKFKLRLQISILLIQNRYLLFKSRNLLRRKRKPLP